MVVRVKFIGKVKSFTRTVIGNTNLPVIYSEFLVQLGNLFQHLKLYQFRERYLQIRILNRTMIIQKELQQCPFLIFRGDKGPCIFKYKIFYRGLCSKLNLFKQDPFKKMIVKFTVELNICFPQLFASMYMFQIKSKPKIFVFKKKTEEKEH